MCIGNIYVPIGVYSTFHILTALPLPVQGYVFLSPWWLPREQEQGIFPCEFQAQKSLNSVNVQ